MIALTCWNCGTILTKETLKEGEYVQCPCGDIYWLSGRKPHPAAVTVKVEKL